MRLRVTWRGDEVLRDVQIAAAAGLEETAQLAMAHAQSTHPGWQNQSGQASRSLKSSRVVQRADGAHVWVGFFGIPYGGKLEGRDNTLERSLYGAAEGLPSRIERRLQ